ncbi:IucA/IucC family siderophore biosynthesis protein [Streptomyces piniterrae]|uniref:IucA/IucC family siderophore biosynthesis protein n=1 Tax=Streptomyces piniterrae TaxID=2571125 RepID=A0A4U0NIV3_9ACTN|nr:IucA/IucC family protein [Streptomyces piniterrae]TJZ54177.1 IucA/IucC family siderophore biosynthesis protein [Streptomyces piniterrae]
MTSPESVTTTAARSCAEQAARTRLLNTYLRESGTTLGTTCDDLGRIQLPATGSAVVIAVRHRSVFGHHEYGNQVWLEQPDRRRVPVDHDDVVRLLLDEVQALAAKEFAQASDGADRKRELAERIESSVAATSRYLRHRRPCPADPYGMSRHAEQSLVFGHPFHPTPKSTQGFGDDLERYAPELGAAFVPHWFAVNRRILLERRVAPGSWTPAPVTAAARQMLGAEQDHALLPAHPWQAEYLLSKPRVAQLVGDGLLVALGALGPEVYPTSSVRTVCDPAFPTFFKLPLHVRITNFIRNNPVPHVLRATDAGVLVTDLAPGWDHPGFSVLVETGFRTVDPAVIGDDLAAEFSVLYRENPFTDGAAAPRVLAGLLENRDGDVPDLIHEIRRCAPYPDAVSGADHVAKWLRRYLSISLLPLLEIFDRDGVSFEAHVQNSLLHTDGGWPVRYWVRDMEGTSVSRQRLRPGTVVPPDSPLLYDHDEAWLRLRYNAVTNHLGHLISVVGRYTDADEPLLWRVARQSLATSRADTAADLLERPVLPAKANLISRFAGRGESPVYVDVPNLLFEVSP